MLVTFSRLAIERLRLRQPEIQTKGFAAHLRKRVQASPELSGSWDGAGWVKECGVVPDGWFDDGEDVFAIEIEDTNPLSMEKLRRLTKLWFDLDYYWVSLRLLLYDRYGDNKRELDLHEQFYLLYAVDQAEARANRHKDPVPKCQPYKSEFYGRRKRALA